MKVAELRKLLEGKNPEAEVEALVIKGQESLICGFNGMQAHGAERCLLMVFLPESEACAE